jgi:hypothetical protein
MLNKFTEQIKSLTRSPDHTSGPQGFLCLFSACGYYVQAVNNPVDFSLAPHSVHHPVLTQALFSKPHCPLKWMIRIALTKFSTFPKRLLLLLVITFLECCFKSSTRTTCKTLSSLATVPCAWDPMRHAYLQVALSQNSWAVIPGT